MDLRRLRAGEWLTAASGVALLVSLFLPWYEAVSCVPRDPEAIRGVVTCYGAGDLSGWESLTAIDVVLAFVGATGVLLALVTAAQEVPAVPIALSALVSLFGFVALLLVLLRLVVDDPEWAGGTRWGIWLALVGAIGIVAGTLLSMREEIRPGGARVEIEAIPAPRP